MELKPPPRDPKGMRSGYTTGACAAAAAKAAARLLVQRVAMAEIETTLPNRNKVRFLLKRCERVGNRAICSVIKDAGDDPDCTHGAEMVAEVILTDTPGIVLHGGEGVATVTKPGLGLDVNGPAINPVPRRNITEMVQQELAASGQGAVVTLSIPGGEEMAKQTLNARLGLIGGISILGTTGIVLPYSTSAFRASVVQSIDVAAARGHQELVLTTGGKSEAYAMALYPHLAEECFIQMGDFVGAALRRCARAQVPRATLVGMVGKLSKMADGQTQTHAAGSEVNLEFLSALAEGLGGSETVCEQIRHATTARHVLEICRASGLSQITDRICQKVVEELTRYVEGKVEIKAVLVDFSGPQLGQYP